MPNHKINLLSCCRMRCTYTLSRFLGFKNPRFVDTIHSLLLKLGIFFLCAQAQTWRIYTTQSSYIDIGAKSVTFFQPLWHPSPKCRSWIISGVWFIWFLCWWALNLTATHCQDFAYQLFQLRNQLARRGISISESTYSASASVTWTPPYDAPSTTVTSHTSSATIRTAVRGVIIIVPPCSLWYWWTDSLPHVPGYRPMNI